MDEDNNGFDDRYEVSMPGVEGTADVELTVTTSRSAALRWMGESLVLEAGTWRVGVRVPREADTRISLEPAPEGVDVSGPWKATMSWCWHPGRHGNNTTTRLPEEGKEDRFLQGPGSVVEIATILGEPPAAAQGFHVMSTRNGTPHPGIDIYYGSVLIDKTTHSVCVRHGTTLVLSATVTGPVIQPVDWFVGNRLYGQPDGTGLTFTPSVGYGTHRIYCGENGWRPSRIDSPPSTNFTPRSYTDLYVYDCGLPQNDILGAAMHSDHMPTNVMSVATANDCTETNLTCYLGFDHDHPNIATRNLSVIPYNAGNDDAYRNTQHTIKHLIWGEGGSIDLASLLAPNALPYMDNIYFLMRLDAKGPQTELENHILKFGPEPDYMRPTIYYIELHYTGVAGVFDSLWVVVNSPQTQTEFSNWVSRNTDISWTANLPKPFSQISVNGNTPVDPEPGAPNLWGTPEWKSTLLHHDAKFEMLSKPTGEGHGHQAWYDADGNLIETTIAAGRAKKFSRGVSDNNTFESHGYHNTEDIYPFVRAAQLDGNPVHPDGVILDMGIDAIEMIHNFTRPCIYMGGNIDLYMDKRPALPTGKQ